MPDPNDETLEPSTGGAGDRGDATIDPSSAGDAATPADDADRIGPYRVLETLGEGGMGTVYLAEQTSPVRRLVALKVVKRGMDTAAVLRRFEAERQALAVMEHPGIARVFDAGATREGRPYFVMEHVAGEPINLYADRRRLSLDARLKLFAKVCDAVQHAHTKGVIHRDLKPGNVLVTEVDGEAVPKVIDFGVAKVTTDTNAGEESLMTQVGQIVGTPEYMSPEQAENGPAGIDTRTDVYALGVILYELLAGSLPFEPRTLRRAAYAEVRRIIREDDPPPPSARVTALTRTGGSQEDALRVADARRIELGRLAKTLAGELEWIPLKAMRKDRDRRYDSAGDLAGDVRNYLAGRALTAAPESRVYLAKKFARRHRPTLAAAAAVLLAITLGTVAATWQAVRATRAERVAVQQRDRALDLAALNAEVNGFLTDVLASADPAREQGRPTSVREVVEQAVVEARGRFDDRPLVRAGVLTTLAEVVISLGRPAEAVPLVEEAETLYASRGDEGGELRAKVLRGIILDESGDADAALPLLADAHRRQRALLGPDDPATLRTAHRHADVLDRVGRGEEAAAMWADVLDRRSRSLGVDHGDTLDSLNARAFLERHGGDLEASEATLRDVLSRRRRTVGEGHPRTIHAVNNLATVVSDAGSPDEAERLYRQSITAAEAVLGHEHYHTAQLRENLGLLLFKLERHDEAERELIAAARSLRRFVGDGNERTQHWVRRLATFYEKTGRPDEAARWPDDPPRWPRLDEMDLRPVAVSE